MKIKTLLHLGIVILALPTLACDLALSTSPAEEPPNTQATIDAAVAATAAAQEANREAIEAAVQATTMAHAAATLAVESGQATADAATAAAQATVTPAAESTPVSTEATVEMTEEELAALIDEAVTEAVAASEEYSTAATQAAADDTVTQDEVQAVEIYFANADEALAYAEELLGVYTSMYGALAVETVDEIQQIEEDLAEIAAATAELNAVLTDIDSALEQGLELADDTITQLETAAQTINQQTQAAQEASQAWQAAHQSEHDGRIATAVAVPPTQIDGDPLAALQSSLEFVQAGQHATADGQISVDELAALAQLGANTAASLGQTGNPQMQELSGLVTTVTEHLAGGNLPQAQAGLDQLGVAAPLALPPNQIEQDPRAAIQTALQFAATGQQLLNQGGQPSPQQLAQFAQLAANASAGLNASGMPQLQQLSGSINDVTGQIALGRTGQAQMQLDQLGASLNGLPDIQVPQKPALPEKPSLPDKPSLPQKPGRG